MNNPVISGSTAECSEHFFANNDWLLARACLSEFVQVDGQAVRKWYTGKQLPVGLGLLRFRVFLDLLGYEVDEFNLLPDVTKDFSRLIAFGYISHAEALKMMDYANEKGLFDIILRAKSPQRERVYRIERFVEDSSDELEGLKQKFKKQIRSALQLDDEQDASEEEPVGAIAIVSASDLEEVEPIVDAIVSTIASADAVVRMLDFDPRADELVVKIAERVDFADLNSLRSTLEVIQSVAIRGSSESQ